MSDVHVSTSWSTIPDGSLTYNTVLSCEGYNDDNERLFASIQAVPNIPVNVSTPYARGFTLISGYNGKVEHSMGISQEDNLKTVKFKLSNAGQVYDLTDVRCYVQFKNWYNVNIATWVLQHIAEDDTPTTLAAGTNLAQYDTVQIDFKNDYGAGRIEFVITYSGEIIYQNFKKLEQGDYQWQQTGYLPYNQVWPGGYLTSPTGAPDKTVEMYFSALTEATNRFFIFTKDTSASNTYTVCTWGSSYTSHNNYDRIQFTNEGEYYYASAYTSARMNAAYNALITDGYKYANSTDAYNAMMGATGGGLSTSDFNNYNGDIWQCRMIADISEVFPGKVTENRGGEDVDYDDTSDTNTTPTLPTIDDVETAGTGDSMRIISPYAIYKLTSNQYHLLRTALFTSDIWTNLANYFAKPMDCIISVGHFPFTPTTVQANVAIYAGSVPLYYAPATQAVCKGDAINRFQSIDLGSVTIKHYYDTALDYNPYTKAKIHLPFIGDRQIDIDLIMNKTVGLKYHVDMITGSCIAYVTADDDLLVQYMGNCMAYAPLSGEDWSSVYGAILQATASSAVSSLASGFPMAGAAQGAASAAIHTKIGFDGNTSTGGATTLLECLQPYIELLRPEQVLPRNYPAFKGYISDVTAQLRECSGFTQVLDIHLDNVPCTEQERAELHSLLGRGIII